MSYETEPLHPDPEEQIRIENEILQLKIRAELGGISEISDGLPPEIARQFLQQVAAFHQSTKTQPETLSLREYLGNPSFPQVATLSQDQLEASWNNLSALLEAKRVQVDFLADEYSLATRYEFIIGELFDFEIQPPVEPGQYIALAYEDFHDNHPYDMKNRVAEMMQGFFENNIEVKLGWYLAGTLVTSKGTAVSREELARKVARFHDQLESIRDYYCIEDVSFETPAEENEPMMGYVEGMLHYTVTTRQGQEVPVTGPFKFYLQCESGWWTIFSFYLHGFSWE